MRPIDEPAGSQRQLPSPEGRAPAQKVPISGIGASLVRMRPRFELRPEPDGLWSVIDIFTSKPALVDGVRQTHRQKDEAETLATRLNEFELKGLRGRR